jgi:hypothetical protein
MLVSPSRQRETGTDATLMDAVAQQFRKTADRGHGGEDMAAVIWPITDEGVAVGGAFYSDTATGMMPMTHRVAGVLAFQ